MQKSKSDGFTLIELLVVLLIVGLVAGLVIPRVFNTLTHVELKSATRETASFLDQARDFSYYKKKYMKVSFNLTTGHISLSEQQNTTQEDNFSAGPEMVWVRIKDFFLPEGVYVQKCVQKDKTTESGVFNILFYPAGNANGGTIRLMNKKGRHFLIRVDTITGDARIIEEKNENE